jgi:FdhD protein
MTSGVSAGAEMERADPGSTPRRALAFRHGKIAAATRAVAAEVPVALSFNGASHAVMMATPCDLEDFAIGFALTQGIISQPADIETLSIEPAGEGLDCQIWIASERAAALSRKRRALAGPTGCGICGVEGIDEAMPMIRPVAGHWSPAPQDIMAAMASLAPAQKLGIETRAVHAAGYWTKERGLVAIREDVGRHNALDKLAGALAVMPDVRRDGMVLLTSRVSVEMVQKCAVMGISVLAAVSAPTTLAIRTAENADIMLIGIARADGFETFTFSDRLTLGAADCAA